MAAESPLREPTFMPRAEAGAGDIDLRRPASIAVVAVLIGAAGLLTAWLLGSPATAAVLSTIMKANTALALGTLAASLLLHLRRQGRAGQALAGAGLIIDGLTHFESAAGVDLRLDQAH